mgnify:CR=1 FL=1
MKGKDSPRTKYTNGQLKIYDIVQDLGFSADLEVEFAPYVVDIYIHEVHVAIEFDGHFHWKKRDARRDKELFDVYFLPVLRLTKEFPKMEVKKKILGFIAEWASSSKERKNRIGY